MSENDIDILRALLAELKTYVIAIDNKLDQSVLEIATCKNDIGSLFQANSEIKIAQKKCQEDEGAKLDAITAVMKPAIADEATRRSRWQAVKSILNKIWADAPILFKEVLKQLPLIIVALTWLGTSCNLKPGKIQTAINGIKAVATYIATPEMTETP